MAFLGEWGIPHKSYIYIMQIQNSELFTVDVNENIDGVMPLKAPTEKVMT